MEQLTHYNTNFNSKTFPITIICDEVYLQDNIGSVFRVCDSFGIEKIIFTGENFIFSERKINKTSRNTHKKIPFEIISNKQSVINSLQEIDCIVIALEITTISLSLQSLKEKFQKPVYLIIGNEVNGISDEFLSISDKQIHIDMYGKNSSMNVSHSLAICLFHLINNNF